ncbi:adenosylcobinamide-GDP ribazoletransferase [Peteryoungia desertarenae]|uniref:Adenosylcobinamide-GDP ribazoletransferase n=1 Tax=Peteryoungia desertarenae TaxID=1813451 RepID=A0ABX6QQA3_9HYPH|nr:adenosylcobinamide-GDP ribazoletransferase [Peteryoungia desertarenae]QLF70761.1 adenosylcobinamide-GDP ribazoletransferase [Peteryoungia desertarenae]
MLSLRDIIDETARALAFLSRLPIPDRFFVGHDGRLTKTVAAFPLAGLLLSLPAAFLMLILLSLHTSALLVALMAITIQIFITGGLHEDGLSDTTDGLGAGRDRQRALEIMKDSRLGSYGALAMILSLGLRVTALAAIAANLPAISAALVFVAASVGSRALIVWHWSTLPPARPDGVASGAGQPEPEATRFALLSGLALVAVTTLPAITFATFLGAIVAAIMAAFAFTSNVRRRLGGQTGDTIGACQQIAETAFLVALAIAT